MAGIKTGYKPETTTQVVVSNCPRREHAKLKFRGIPFGPIINGKEFRWNTYLEYLQAMKGNYMEFDGWKFDLDYGLIYLRERREAWVKYIPPSGLAGKRVLDVGGGCGESAKFFLDNGAESVHVLENNEKCRQYLQANHSHDNRMTFEIVDFQGSEASDGYDLVKIDIEGYEMRLVPYLDKLNTDIIIESHCNYITDTFLDKGFSLLNSYKENKEIYGGVVYIYRLKL